MVPDPGSTDTMLSRSEPTALATSKREPAIQGKNPSIAYRDREVPNFWPRV